MKQIQATGHAQRNDVARNHPAPGGSRPSILDLRRSLDRHRLSRLAAARAERALHRLHLRHRSSVVAEPEITRDAAQAHAQHEWLADLSAQYMRYLPDQTAVPEIDTVDLDALTNALIMSLNLDVEEKPKLLEMSNVATRAGDIGTELLSRIESLRFLAPYRHG